MTDKRLKVAVPVPVRDGFDYLWNGAGPVPAPGTRVRVPFGRQEKIGIVIDVEHGSGPGPTGKNFELKAVLAALDDEPVIHGELLATLAWAAGYYEHPIGDVLAHGIPAALRKGADLYPAPEAAWELTAAGQAQDLTALARKAPRQAAILERLNSKAGDATAVAESELKAPGSGREVLRRLEQLGWIRQSESRAGKSATSEESGTEAAMLPAAATIEKLPELTADQRRAVDTVLAGNGFASYLLYGVTGSGKTEVFLRLISEALNKGQQCLLLVPEIGLTPQLVQRLRARFGAGTVVFHSGLTPTERLKAWRDARNGTARLLVGTRSAVFTALPQPGLIVVDEEHDSSYKQQSGFRYSARDLAVVRAKALNIPIVLASATPSLESFHNAREQRYQLLSLPQRIGSGGVPALRVIDLNLHATRQGLSTPLLAAIDRHLGLGRQVLLFINRRGFAPALFCPQCEKTVDCGRCDSRLTVHASAGQLRCHHCGRSEKLEWACPVCTRERVAVGEGTQRVTSEIESLYPDHEVARLDRDAVSGRDQLGEALGRITAGKARIIIGTQLLTKGHDFPGVTLVGVLNADQGLFGTDFRSEERLAQTIVQVAGRAGRRDEPGEVLIQTHYPGHPLLKQLLAEDYGAFAQMALIERQQSGWPPFTHLALLRAEAGKREDAFAFLNRLRNQIGPQRAGLSVLGPTPDWMERREGRYRASLLLQSASRQALHQAIQNCLGEVPGWRETRRVRWSLDIDPVEM